VDSLEAGTDIVEEGEDLKRLEWRRGEVTLQGGGGGAMGGGVGRYLTDEEKRLQKEAQKNMTG